MKKDITNLIKKDFNSQQARDFAIRSTGSNVPVQVSGLLCVKIQKLLKKYKEYVPTVTYKKWWHRFSPHHRKMIRIMNKMMAIEYPRMEKKIQEQYKNFIIFGLHDHGN